MVLYPNKLPESERVCSGICKLNAAIGWLACEGKIQFDESMQGQNTALYIELSYYIG